MNYCKCTVCKFEPSNPHPLSFPSGEGSCVLYLPNWGGCPKDRWGLDLKKHLLFLIAQIFHTSPSDNQHYYMFLAFVKIC